MTDATERAPSLLTRLTSKAARQWFEHVEQMTELQAEWTAQQHKALTHTKESMADVASLLKSSMTYQRDLTRAWQEMTLAAMKDAFTTDTK